MNLFTNGLFKYLEKANPTQILDQLDTRSIINFCQYALEVQMYASDNYTSSNEGPVKLNELDLPSVSTTIEIPQVSLKTLSNNNKDLMNIICVVNRETNNLPETLKNLKEKMKQSLKEKEKTNFNKTKYHGVYQQDNMFMSYFEKSPGQKTEKIGEYKSLIEAAKSYDQYIIKKDLNYRKKSKEDGYYPLNFPSRSRSRSRSRSSEDRRNNRKSNTNNEPSRRSVDFNNRRYHNRDYNRNKDSKFINRRDERKESPYKQSHINKDSSIPNNNNKSYGFSNSLRNPKDIHPNNKTSNFSNSHNNFSNNNSSSNNRNTQINMKANPSPPTNTPIRDSLPPSLSNKKKNLSNQYPNNNNVYQNYQYQNNYSTYLNKSTAAGYYMNENQNTSYSNYNSGYYPNNNNNYYQNYPQNNLNHNLYNQGNVYQNYIQPQQTNLGYNANNQQFNNQSLTNPAEITSYGYKRNYGQNSNNFNGVNFSMTPNANYNVGKNNSEASYDDEMKITMTDPEIKKFSKNESNQIQMIGKKEGEEKKNVLGEPSTMVMLSDINQNINY